MQLLSRLSRVKIGVGLIGLAAIFVATAWLAPTQGDDVPAGPVGQSALRVSIDPETGELVKAAPSNLAARGDAELAHMLSRSDEGLREVTLPDGSVMVNLEGRFMNATIARIDGDGQLKTECVHSLEQAEHFMSCEHDHQAPALEVK